MPELEPSAWEYTKEQLHTEQTHTQIYTKLPSHGVRYDASGIHQVSLKQHPALGAIQLCNFYSIQVRISPENVAAKMVKGNAFWTSKI